MLMRMYKRYVDDSNQLVESAPPNTVYNIQTGKLVKDNNLDMVQTVEERMVRILLGIASSVQDGIIMEANYPGKNLGNKVHSIARYEGLA